MRERARASLFLEGPQVLPLFHFHKNSMKDEQLE